MEKIQQGFTLIETLMVMGITVVVLVVLTLLIQNFYKSNEYVLEQTQAIESARRSVDSALSNIREASYAADGSYPITVAATSTFTFYSDISGSNVLERVRYYLSGPTLLRSTVEPAGNPLSYAGQPEVVTLVVDNVRNDAANPLFRFFDSSGNELVAPVNVSKIASVRITVLTDVNPYRAPLVYTLSADVTIRSLKSEL